jgi:hypothetical protein
MENNRAAIAMIAILLGFKVIAGVLLLFFLPVGETASLYVVVHLGMIFGIVPVGLLLGGSVVFWWKVLRLRARRRRLQWLEWHVDEQLGPSV